jgi:hypothetical protein
MHERLLYRPTCWSFDDAGTPVEIQSEFYLEAVATKAPGDVVRSWAGAPGIGYTDDLITRIDATGVYGVTIQNTVRVLTAREVV